MKRTHANPQIKSLANAKLYVLHFHMTCTTTGHGSLFTIGLPGALWPAFPSIGGSATSFSVIFTINPANMNSIITIDNGEYGYASETYADKILDRTKPL